MTCPTSGQRNDISRPNIGIFLHEIQNFEVQSETWLHVYTFELPNVEILQNDSHFTARPNVAALRNVAGQLYATAELQYKYLATTIREIEALIPDIPLPSGRVNRGLCTFCGNVLKSLFGLSTESDVNRALQTVREVSKTTALALKEFQSGSDKFTSYIEVNNKRFETMENVVKRQQATFSTFYEQVMNQTVSQNEQLRLETFMIDRLTKCTFELNALTELRAAIINLKHQTLTADLIPTTEIERTILHIQQYLKQNHIPLRLIQPNVMQTFQSRDFIYFRTGHKIHITLKFKLSHLTEPLTLYKIFSQPLRVPNQEHATQISGLPKYLGWNTADNFYIQSNDPFHFNQPNIYHLDAGLQVLLSKDTTTCLTSLIADSLTDITTYCNKTLLPFSVSPQIYAINPNTLLLFNIPTYSISYSNGSIRNYQGCESCTIFLPCHATFDAPQGRYLARQINCNDESVSQNSTITSVGHFINLNLLSEFFDKKLIQQFSGNQLTAKPLAIKIPDLKLFQNQYTADIAVIDQQSLQLRQIANQTKNDAMIFGSLSHKLSYDLEMNNLEIAASSLNYDSIQFWIYGATTIATILLIVAFIYLNLKIKAIAATLCLLQRPPGVLAESMTSISPTFDLDFFRLRPTMASTNQQTFTPQLSEHIPVTDVFLIIMFSCFWLYLIYRFYDNFHSKHQFDLYLEVGNQNSSIKIKLITLRHDPSMYTFKSQTFIKFIQLSRMHYFCARPKLHLSWTELQIIHKVTGISHHLPEFYNIPYFTGLKLQELLNNQYYVLLFVKGLDNQYSLVHLMDSEWARFPPTTSAQQRVNPLSIISLYPPLPPPANFDNIA